MTAFVMLLGVGVGIGVAAADDPVAGDGVTAPPAEPVMTVLADKKTVQGSVEVQVDLATARALVQDPHQTARASGDGVILEPLGTDGACRRYRWTVPHAIKTVSYVARMCDTASGTEIQLVESDDLAAYASTWSVEAVSPDTVRVTCEVRTEPSFPIPASIVRGQTKKGLFDSLARIKHSLEGRR